MYMRVKYYVDPEVDIEHEFQLEENMDIMKVLREKYSEDYKGKITILEMTTLPDCEACRTGFDYSQEKHMYCEHGCLKDSPAS